MGECIRTEQQIQELCHKHGFKYDQNINAIIYPAYPSWTVINVEFQYHNIVRLHFMKFVFDRNIGIKTKNCGLVKRVYGLTCEELEEYLKKYLVQYKKVKITERKFFMNGDFYECKDTE